MLRTCVQPAFPTKNGDHFRRNCRALDFLLVSPFSSVFSLTFIRLKSIHSLRILFMKKRVLQRVQDSAQCFKSILFFLRLSSSCSPLLPRVLARSGSPSITCYGAIAASHYDVGLLYEWCVSLSIFSCRCGAQNRAVVNGQLWRKILLTSSKYDPGFQMQ